MEKKKIKRNAAVCHGCGEEIESTSGHDFKWCACHSLAVDGGRLYLKRCFNSKVGWTDVSEYEEG